MTLGGSPKWLLKIVLPSADHIYQRGVAIAKTNDHRAVFDDITTPRTGDRPPSK
jgi:hypothetical protein